MSSDNPDTRTNGENITIAGLCVQVMFFGFFLISSIIFHKRIRKEPTSRSLEATRDWTGNISTRNWVTILIVLYVVSVLILVRSIFRLVEFIDGYGGYLMTHEVYLYIFDAVPMSAAMAVMSYWHPAFVLRERKGSASRGDFRKCL